MISSKVFLGTALGIIAIALFAFFFAVEQPVVTLGESAASPVTPRIATTTTVGPQGATVVKTQLFAANASCKSRVISTVGTAIMISFDDIAGAGNVGSTTVSGTIGHVQGASTTVAYDAGLFGCGVWNAWATASTTITTLEAQ